MVEISTWRSIVASRWGPSRSTTRLLCLSLSIHENPSLDVLADAIGATEATVRNHLIVAEKDGWIEVKRNGRGWTDAEYEFRIPQRAIDGREGRIQEDDEDDPKDEPKYPEECWQIQFTDKLIRRLRDNGSLSYDIDKASEKRLVELRQRFAGEFDKLHAKDGHSIKTIARVMGWVLRPECWWMATKNFRTPMKMRDKNRSGERFFSVWLMQMTAELKMRKSALEQIEPDVDYVEDDARKRAEAAGLRFPDDFWKNGTNWKGETLWQLKTEVLQHQ